MAQSYEQYEHKITIDIKKKDILLIRNILAEVCYGAHPVKEEGRFEKLFGSTEKYAGDLCFFFKKTMDENDIVE